MNTGFIYKIFNDVNEKVYIGQTTQSIKARWSGHKHDMQTTDSHLYRAMRKYGIDNFHIEIIVECHRDELNELEIYYINKYDSIANGYNSTSGGNQCFTRRRYTDEAVIRAYEELQHVGKVADIFGSRREYISDILKNNGVEVIQHKPPRNCRPVRIVELNESFESMIACGKWLIDNGFSKASQPEQAMKSIQRVLRGERQSYCKFHFEEVHEIEKFRGELLL